MGWSILSRAEAREDALHLVTVASRRFRFPAVPPASASVSRQGRSSLADFTSPPLKRGLPAAYAELLA